MLDTLTCKLMFSMQNLASMISLFVTIALCSRLEHHEHGVEIYNCCFEPAYTIQHIVEAMKKVTGLTQFVPDIPNWVIMPMARMAMLLGSPMGICPARVKKLQISTNICGEKLKNCGYQFKWSFEEALADWFEDNDRQGLK